jgi:hypothetical protein
MKDPLVCVIGWGYLQSLASITGSGLLVHAGKAPAPSRTKKARAKNSNNLLETTSMAHLMPLQDVEPIASRA